MKPDISVVAARWTLSRHCISFWRYGDHEFKMRSDYVLYIIRESSQSSLLKFLLTIAIMERALAVLNRTLRQY